MATAEADRTYVRDEWVKIHGRLPTVAELADHTGHLQRGMPRVNWLDNVQRNAAPELVRRASQELNGRPATDADVAYWSQRLRSGVSPQQMREEIAGGAEALLRPPPAPDTSGQEDAFVCIKNVLDGYGLGGLGQWAWDQIEGGFSNERIVQNLRETTEYKQRFKGLEERRAAGLPAISEGEYIAYETNVRQMMRGAGLPAEFYDSPEDFADLIGKDMSPAEMQARIQDGYAAAAAAPPEVRAQLKDLYGVGEGGLAAFYLDPDRALPLIERQFQAAKISGAAQRTGYGALNQTEAERLAELGVSDQQAQQGFSALEQSKELFGSMPGENSGAIDRATQQAAVFGGDANAQQSIEKRRSERVSAGSGARSFSVGQGGIAGLGVER